jgi:maltodextrin utilization protein YvdJ
MKFAAGLTVSGVVGFLVLEALKLVVPTLAVWIIAILAFVFKAILILMVLGLVGAVIGIGVFFYKRQQRRTAEV